MSLRAIPAFSSGDDHEYTSTQETSKVQDSSDKVGYSAGAVKRATACDTDAMRPGAIPGANETSIRRTFRCSAS
jgi:hypothetical protein